MLVLLIAVFSSTIVGSAQQNCSNYDPCGKYGYCHDSDGQWSCDCTFWWNGTLCNQQTESGKQVIILGCLLAFLLAIFYGLGIATYIRARRRRKKDPPVKKVIIEESTFVDLAVKTARHSARRSSCIVAIFVMILAAVALVSKWAIIQPIHNEIVQKSQTNQSVYYTPNSVCNLINYEQFNLLTFPVACALILCFIIRTKRTSLLRDKCRGHGGPPIPADFLSYADRKFAAVIFAICADELLAIMQQALGNGKSTKAEGVILVYLVRVAQVIVMGFHYYPFLAAVYIDSIFTLTLATLYAWLDYAVTIINLGMCKSDFYPTYEDFLDNSNDMTSEFEYYGTGPNLIAIQLCTDIPRFLCLAYVSVKIPMLLAKRIYYQMSKNIPVEKRILRKLTREQRTFFYICSPDSLEMLYVKNLFRSADQRPRTHSLIGRLIPKKIYEWRDDFRFSTRVLCVYSSIFLLLYFVTIQACVRVLPVLSLVQTFMQAIMDALTQQFLPIPSQSGDTPNTDINENTSNFPVPSLVRPYLFAIFFTVAIIVSQLLVMLVNIRRNLFQSFRGDDSELPRRVRSKNVSYSSGNVHFAGYFIGYLIWGFILIAVFVSIICIAIEGFITFGNVRLVEKALKGIIPSVLFIFFKQYLNKILAKYVFLQHNGLVLSLNNRRILMIFIYFNFFLDAFLGFISSIVRLVKSVIGGIIYMCRLDYSPLGRKLETMDGGFSAYCGFIHTECAHRHPVLLVFISHLYTQMKMKQLAMGTMQFGNIKLTRPPTRFAWKWRLAVFLIRNPSIVFFRKAFLRQLPIDEVHALNDVDDDGKKNLKKRLSVYARRMSAAQLSVNSSSSYYNFQASRF